MKQWTTPTLPVTISTGLIESCDCDVYGTFEQRGKSLTIQPYSVESDTQHNKTRLLFDLTQLQTGGFCAGVVSLQVNFVDWMNYRAATNIAAVPLGSNILRKELAHG